MRFRNGIAPLAGGALLLIVSAVGATTYAAFAEPPALTLTGAQEVPEVDTLASASSSIVVGQDMSVTGDVETSEIEGTMAHIHQGALGVRGPIVVTLEKTSATQWSVPANTGLTAVQYEAYEASELYVNVHSVAHTSGEIRVQLIP
jgi:CHRD domain